MPNTSRAGNPCAEERPAAQGAFLALGVEEVVSRSDPHGLVYLADHRFSVPAASPGSAVPVVLLPGRDRGGQAKEPKRQVGDPQKGFCLPPHRRGPGVDAAQGRAEEQGRQGSPALAPPRDVTAAADKSLLFEGFQEPAQVVPDSLLLDLVAGGEAGRCGRRVHSERLLEHRGRRGGEGVKSPAHVEEPPRAVPDKHQRNVGARMYPGCDAPLTAISAEIIVWIMPSPPGRSSSPAAGTIPPVAPCPAGALRCSFSPSPQAIRAGLAETGRAGRTAPGGTAGWPAAPHAARSGDPLTGRPSIALSPWRSRWSCCASDRPPSRWRTVAALGRAGRPVSSPPAPPKTLPDP